MTVGLTHRPKMDTSLRLRSFATPNFRPKFKLPDSSAQEISNRKWKISNRLTPGALNFKFQLVLSGQKITLLAILPKIT
jgi:hypothetical protein